MTNIAEGKQWRASKWEIQYFHIEQKAVVDMGLIVFARERHARLVLKWDSVLRSSIGLLALPIYTKN